MREKFGSFFISVITLGWYPYVVRNTHIEMVEEFCLENRKCSYDEFQKLFNSVEWYIHKTYTDSLFSKSFTSQCHASIIEIDNVGLKLSAYGLYMANKLIQKKINELNAEKNESNFVTL